MEHRAIVFRETQGYAQILVDKTIEPSPHPSADEIVALFNGIADLRAEIRDLNECLS